MCMDQTPLPEKLRPPALTGFVGQEHLTGKEGVVKKLITSAKETGFFPSLIFWGPPGSGKTTLARIIANKLNREFFEFSAVNTSIKDVEEIINKIIQIKGAPGQMKLVKKTKKKKEKARQSSLLMKFTDLIKLSRTNFFLMSKREQ